MSEEQEACSSFCHPEEECAITEDGVCDARRDVPCASQDWTPAVGSRYELDRIEGGHVFAWQFTPSLHSQYLLCVVCKRPHHVLFPENATRREHDG